MQSQQLLELSRNPVEAYVLNIATHHIFRLAGWRQEVRAPFYSEPQNNVTLLIENGPGDVRNEWNWNKDARFSIYVMSLKDGFRTLVKKNVPGIQAVHFFLTPNGEYVVFYNGEQGNYFSYEISTGVTRNLTVGIKATWKNRNGEDQPVGAYTPTRMPTFVSNSNCVLLYDRFDIYEVDLSGKIAARNITNGYGQKHHLEFRLAISSKLGPVDLGRDLILSAFDTSSKEAGFYSVLKGEYRDPQLLSMYAAKFDYFIEKAKDADIFVLKRMTASNFPNLFFTTDFRKFVPLTNVHPEKKYNWMTSELLTWKELDGRITQGVLYKPENFNPRIKYPIIFYYYERLSDDLHDFKVPAPSRGTLDIPLYVSNGYLVLTPDIHYTIGYPGRSAYNAVVSAADYVSKLPFVDAKRMGLQGHSFGGFETNYIITHTDLFAAAVSASGMSDFVSIYGSIIGDGTSRQRQYELYRDRIGATLWDRPDLYIENSPVLRADKIRTPLLMMADANDGDVPWQQGIELFTALRRLGKKAWMLQYDGEGHILASPRAQKDFSLRMFQFFNHYLKGVRAPTWMTQGVPGRLKGIDTGLELGDTIAAQQ